MKRRFGVVLVLVLSITSGLIGGASVSATGEWANRPISVVSSGELPFLYETGWPCDGRLQTIEVSGRGRFERACVYGDVSGMQFATYFDNSFRAAVAFPDAAVFTELRGVCGIPRCVYAAESDTFLEHRGLPQWSWGVGVYKDFSKKLVKVLDPLTLRHYFEFQPTDGPDFTAKIGGTEVSVEAIGVSANGEWAVLEMKRTGVLLVNLLTFESRRILAPGAEYGLFSDPRFEIAVAHDGSLVAMTGWNGGASMIIVDKTCGDRLTETSLTTLAPGSHHCQTVPLPVASDPTTYYATQPRFSSDSRQLGIAILPRQGAPQRLILSPFSHHKSLDYLALGVSFTSGDGELGDRFYKADSMGNRLRCHLSLRSYPYLIGRQWGLSTESAACSGATINDITGTGSYDGQRGYLTGMDQASRSSARAHALSTFQAGVVRQTELLERYQPGLVTVSIGGNDAGLVGKLTACLMPQVCEWAKDESMRRATGLEIQAIFPKIHTSIQAIREHSPSSKIAVIGYPVVLNQAETASCGPLLDLVLAAEERTFINESIRYLNKVLQAAAALEQAPFIDVEDSLKGEELCGTVSSLAMNNIRLGDDIAPIQFLDEFRVFGSESFHPTPRGHEMIAKSITSQVSPHTIVAAIPCEHCLMPTGAPELPAYWGNQQQSVRRQVSKQLTTSHAVSPSQNLTIAIDPLRFKALSPVRVEVHSEKKLLVEGFASQDGSFVSKLQLPGDLLPGYHTLHLYGTAADDTLVDYYQVIAVVKAVVATGIPVGDAISGLVSSHNIPDLRQKVSNSPAHDTPPQRDVLGLAQLLPLAQTTPLSEKNGEGPRPNMAAMGIGLLAAATTGLIIWGYSVSRSRKRKV